MNSQLKKKRAPRFVKAYTRILRDPRILPIDKLVLFVIKSYADENDHCYPSVQRIADDLGVQRNTVIRSIARLSDEKVRLITRISRYRGSNQTSSDYHIDDLHFAIHRAVSAGAKNAPLGAGAKNAPRSRSIEEEKPPEKNVIRFRKTQ